ncbi:MAG: hypothetical protein DRO00_06990 [Thermoproteota archaeon]|nr:MAG: hypothetical protein DRN90_04480 [Candidatus Korarchaeota archaeon]RLG48433.1 MAG: hypothetical protein DRN92_01000 [Candidatus Korarchaeota archaeon]RLG51588.1 MAG: hypothetical protein DRO00_06990 [Candidatus Korarchaeota archaeon]
MRKYVDLKVWSFSSNVNELRSLIDVGVEMGFWALGITCYPEKLEKTQEIVKKLTSEGYRVFTSLEIELLSPRALRIMSKLMKKRIFLSIKPLSLEMARRAVKLKASSIVLPINRNKLIFDSVCAKELLKREGAVEIHLVDLLKSEEKKLLRAIRMIRLEVQIARKYGIPIIVSSGATREIELLDPIIMASIAETFLKIPKEAALNSISDYPCSLLEKGGFI